MAHNTKGWCFVAVVVACWFIYSEVPWDFSLEHFIYWLGKWVLAWNIGNCVSTNWLPSLINCPTTCVASNSTYHTCFRNFKVKNNTKIHSWQATTLTSYFPGKLIHPHYTSSATWLFNPLIVRPNLATSVVISPGLGNREMVTKWNVLGKGKYVSILWIWYFNTQLMIAEDRDHEPQWDGKYPRHICWQMQLLWASSLHLHQLSSESQLW